MITVGNFQRVILTRDFPLCSSLKVDPTRIDLSNLEARKRELFCEYGVALDFLNYFLRHRAKTIEYRYPSSWWEHTKERFFPAWMLKHFPVDYRVDTVEISEVFPFNSMVFPEELGEQVVIAIRNHDAC